MSRSRFDGAHRMAGVLCAIGGFSVAMMADNALGQCDSGLGCSLGLNVPVGQAVHIGDAIAITAVTVFNGPTSCAITNGRVWVILPDGSVNPALQDASLPPGPTLPGGQSSFIACPGTVLGPGALGTCVPFPTTYIVNFSDINRTLFFATNLSGSGFCYSSLGRPKTIQFEVAALGDAVGGAGGNASAQSRPVPVIFPCISVTKSCALPCFPYGSSITFTGLVSNSGDSTLNNIAVTDSVPATITFATATTLGHPFNPGVSNINNVLIAGDSVAYTGTYTPTGSSAALCGPFNDTIGATAQDTTGRLLSNTDPCIDSNTGVSTGPRAPVTAGCLVCTRAGLSVTKNYLGLPGASQQFDGVICNTGNVPLLNVSVINDRLLTTGTNLVASFAVLTNGECRKFYATEFTSPDTNSEGLTVTGTDPCSSGGISDRVAAGSRDSAVAIYGSGLQGTNFTLSFSTETNVSYTIQQSESLSPADWQPLAEIMGDGTVATVSDPMTNSQRFYRVWTH